MWIWQHATADFGINYETVGMDSSRAMLSLAKKKAPRAWLSAQETSQIFH
jgi:ubiquinone/menaquinone biosynthesis C-methylase UbiE